MMFRGRFSFEGITVERGAAWWLPERWTMKNGSVVYVR